MALLTGSLFVDILITISTLLGALYCYFTANYDYWKKRGVPYLKPVLIFGNVKNMLLMKENMVFVIDNIYKRFAGERFGGYYDGRKPVLMVRDPELIQRILIKDFSHFVNRDNGLDVKSDPLAGNLFNLQGQVWRNLRNKLTPTFTSGKLKGMLEQLCNCADELLSEIEPKVLQNEAMDAKDLGMIYSVNVKASVAFGLQFKHNSPEEKRFREITTMAFSPSKLRMFKMFFFLYFPKVARFLGFRQFPKDMETYIMNLVRTTIQYREKNNIQRNDFLQLMMNLKAQEALGKEMNWKLELSEDDAYLNQMDYTAKDGHWEPGTKVISEECIAANSLVFLSGGGEVVANSIMYIFYLLAMNPNVQKRLQEEVDSVMSKYGGKITYEGLKEMTYMDLVLQEKNRVYPEGGLLARICESTYKIPGTDVIIEKGTRVMVPVFSIHKDPAYYPDPDAFIPERFEGNNHRITSLYMPFGDGPRVCIAMRFVILEQKVVLAKLMSQYTVTLDPRTKVPLEFNPAVFLLLPKDGIWIRCQKRTQKSS